MPSSRRAISRNQNPAPPVPLYLKVRGDSGTSSCVGDEHEVSGSPMTILVVQPKHAQIPDISTEGNLMFECMLFLYTLMCLGLQYINLYKTVWWLPHSHANYALHFYLIDPYLSVLLVVVMSRRAIWCFVHEVNVRSSKPGCLFWLMQLLKFALVTSFVSAFVYAAYHVVLRHSLLYSLFLCYPLVTYGILFGLQVRPFFGKIDSCQGLQLDSKGSPRHKTRENSSKDILAHNCSMSPEAVRKEVEILKTDFNDRIKEVLFNSMLCAYYMGFVPLCFAQNTLYYDRIWVGQHICLVWISTFVMFVIHYLPARYVDVLHKCALHLGRWIKVEGRHAHVPYNAWSELQVWQQGALVKHVKGLFKAEGINNSAEPGNGMHARFYFMFHRPCRVTNWLLVITAALVVYQFLTLLQAQEWNHIISLALLLLSNYYVLFKILRDWIILGKSYKDEQLTVQM